MKTAYYFALLGISCGIAHAQPMGFPEPVGPFAPPIDAPVPVGAVPSFPVPAEPGAAVPGAAVPAPLTPMGDGAPDAAPQPKDCFRVSLDDGSMILGEIAGEAKVTLKAKVGELEFALGDVARIDPAFADTERVTVTFGNGDRLTGKIAINDVKIKTAWGELAIKAEGLHNLEAGKLYEESQPITRRSLDGRTTVTVVRKHHRFQPTVEAPSAYPARPMYQPSPYTPTPNHNWSAPSTTPPRLTPTTGFAPAS